MKINRNKLDIALARECKTLNDLKSEFCMVTLTRLRNDREYRPTTKTVGRLARALKCNVEELLEQES